MSASSPPSVISGVYNPSNFAVAATLSGTLKTSAQPNITSVGTLTSLNVNGPILQNGSVIDLGLGTGVVAGTASAGKALIVDTGRNISNIATLSATTVMANGVDITTAVAPLGSLTPGVATASKILSTDASKTLTGLTKLTVGAGGTAGVQALNVLSGSGDAGIRLGSSETATKAWTMQFKDVSNVLQWDNFGTSASMSIDPAGNFVAKASVDAPAYKVSGSAVSLGALAGITLGTPSASKALTLDASSQLNGALSTTGMITSTLSANGTSFRSINGSSTCSLFHFASGAPYFGTTSVHDLVFQTSGTQRMTITAAGAVSCSAGFSATTLTGTIQTAAQPNITSIGALVANLVVSGTNKIVMNGQASAVACIDLGAPSTPDRAIALYNNTTSYYGHGVSSSNLKSYSFGGHQWFTGATSSELGTSIMSLTAEGALTTASITATGSLIVGAIDVGATLGGAIGTATAGAAATFTPQTTLTFAAGDTYQRNIGWGSNVKQYFSSADNAMTIDGYSAGVNAPVLIVRNDVHAYSGNLLSLESYSSTTTQTNFLRFKLDNQTTPKNRIYSQNNLAIGTVVASGDLATSANILYFEGGAAGVGFNTTTPDTTRFGLDINAAVKIRTRLCVGDSIDATRMISCLDGSMSTLSARYITLGHSNSTKNQAEISFYYDGNGSDLNRLGLGHHGGEKMSILTSGRVGIGTVNPIANLHVVGTTSVSLGAGAQTIYSLSVSNGTVGNLGAGPQSFALSAVFSGPIQTSSVYTTSDRRLKGEVHPLDITEEHYSRFEPVSFKYHGSAKQEIGLIAQDVLKVASELVNISENPNLRAVDEDDIDSMMYSVDYSKLSVLSAVIIKKMLKRLEKIESYGPMSKFLNKN